MSKRRGFSRVRIERDRYTPRYSWQTWGKFAKIHQTAWLHSRPFHQTPTDLCRVTAMPPAPMLFIVVIYYNKIQTCRYYMRTYTGAVAFPSLCRHVYTTINCDTVRKMFVGYDLPKCIILVTRKYNYFGCNIIYYIIYT